LVIADPWQFSLSQSLKARDDVAQYAEKIAELGYS